MKNIFIKISFRSILLLVFILLLMSSFVGANNNIIYEEDFETMIPLEWAKPDTAQDETFGTTEHKNENLIVLANQYGHIQLYKEFDDAIFEIEYKELEDNERPIRFFVRRGGGYEPWQDNAGYNICLWPNRVAFEITPDINEFVKEYHFEDEDGEKVSYNLREWNTLRIIVKDNLIKVFIEEDGEFVFLGDFEDTTVNGEAKYKIGYFGLFAQFDFAINEVTIREVN